MTPLRNVKETGTEAYELNIIHLRFTCRSTTQQENVFILPRPFRFARIQALHQTRTSSPLQAPQWWCMVPGLWKISNREFERSENEMAFGGSDPLSSDFLLFKKHRE